MKKVLLSTVAAAGIGFVLSAGSASAGDAISKICKDNDDFGMTHGQCVGGFNGNQPKMCRELLEALPPGIYESIFGKENVGACVSYIRAAVNELENP